MTTLLSLYEYADNANIEIDCFRMGKAECFSIVDEKGKVIVFDPYKLKSDISEKVKLAHEIGHHATGAFYDLYADNILRARCEYRANKWAIKKLIPKDELIEALEGGYIDVYELSEYFSVTEDFMTRALKAYGFLL